MTSDSRLTREAARPGTGLDPKDESGGGEANRPEPIPASTIETVALLPCPFCGNDAETILLERGLYFTKCRSCDASSAERATMADSEKAWNTRTTLQPQPVRVDAAQRLQDHMEQFHGVSLKASEWDVAVAAALSQPQGIEWRDIASAPKDETDVLLYFPMESVSHAHHPQTIIGHWHDGKGLNSVGFWVFQHRATRGYSDNFQPTHWLPLPSPPAETKA